MGATLHLQLSAVAGSADAEKNTSAVRIALSITTDSGTYNETGDTSGTITLDGVQIASLAGKKVYYNTTTELYSAQHTVQHKADGTAAVTVRAAFDVNTTYTGVVTAEQTLTLETIPRCSTMTVPVFTLGQPGTLVIQRVAGLTHIIDYTFGTKSGRAVQEGMNPAPVWTPPLELAREIPNDTSGSGTLTITTYSGTTAIGANTYPFTALVPPGVVPAVSALEIRQENDGAVPEDWGVAVKGKTKLSYSAEAAGALGSTITGAVFTCGGVTAQGLSGVTAPLGRSGELTASITVTDSRGRAAALEGGPITVYDYAAPALNNVSVYRCDALGAADGSGDCVAVQAAASCSAVGGHNSVTLRVRHRTSDGGGWSGYGDISNDTLTVLTGFSNAVSYEVEVSAVDALGESRTVCCTVPTAQVAFHLKNGGMAAAFGKYAEKQGYVESCWPLDMHGCRIENLGSAVNDTDAVSKSYVDAALAALSARVTALETGAQ